MSQTKVTRFYNTRKRNLKNAENVKVLQSLPTVSGDGDIKPESKESVYSSKICIVDKDLEKANILNLPQSPKRNLPILNEGSPFKKKPLEEKEVLKRDVNVPQTVCTASKLKGTARRKLQLDSLNSKSKGTVSNSVTNIPTVSQTTVTRYFNTKKSDTEKTEDSKLLKRFPTISEDGKAAESDSASELITSRSFIVNKDAEKTKNHHLPQSSKRSTKKRDVKTAENLKLLKCLPIVSEDGHIKQKAEELVTSSEVTSSRNYIVNKDAKETKNQHLLQSPKRNLPMPTEGTPSKRKIKLDEGAVLEVKVNAPQAVQTHSRSKVTARKKLQLNSAESKVIASGIHSLDCNYPVHSPKKILPVTPEKLDALIMQSRSTSLFPKRSELKKCLTSFTKKASDLRNFQSNPCKINVVISSVSPKKSAASPGKFACDKFNYLAEPDSSSFVLPKTYKLLAEMFSNLDAVVSMLNNRKEKITFDKVRGGVQKIMKRNFTEKHLGQILTVFPTAYSLTVEKCSFISKKANSLDYQLIITPNLTANEDSNKKSCVVLMDPQCLRSREGEFKSRLLAIVKTHHLEFLKKRNIIHFDKDSIRRWDAEFPVDSVPDVPTAELPELPEAKIYSAKDVLLELKKRTICSKVEKALQNATDKSQKSDVTIELKDISNPKPEMSKSALKGIANDLLQRIRAKESAKHLEQMTRTPDETKKLAMLEHLPKIMNILWHYFIAERKKAVHVDMAVEKIIHSLDSLSTPDDVKDHLKLIAEKFPRWLSFIEISKGVFIKIDKNINITEMLDNAGLH